MMKKIGSGRSVGRQPPRGLTPCSLNNACISSFCLIRSFLYWSCSFFISG